MNRGGENIQKKEFIRQINELVPRPDPVTTEALYRFDRECAETEYIDMLTALRVVARNFGEETLQGAYEVIQHQNAALPSELFAAAVYFQAGRTPAEVSGLAKEGRLMGFFGPERPEEPSRIATCTIVESGQEQRFYTMDFGRFNPQHALKRAITYGRETGISATQAMARLTMDQPEFAEKPGGPRCILDGLGSELTEALFQISSACPAVAAHITCNADLGITEVAYDRSVSEEHYGFPHIRPLLGEHPELAERYLREAEARWNTLCGQPAVSSEVPKNTMQAMGGMS